MSSYLYHFKAAVHLNNTALTLMQKRCYRQAAETLIDAVAVLKEASCLSVFKQDTSLEVSSRPSEIKSNEENTVDSLKEKLTKASQRVSKPEPCTPEQDALIHLHVISDDEHPSAVKHYGAQQAKILSDKHEHNAYPSSYEVLSFHMMMNIAHVLRMEPADFEVPSEQDIDIESAVILYNYGVALQCLSTLPQTSEATEKLHVGSFHLFELAYSSLSSRDLGVLRTSAPSQLYRILLVARLSLDQLIKVAKVLHMEEEHYEYYKCLEYLQDSIPDFCLVSDESSTPRAARAA